MIETILHKKINEILINFYGENDYSIQFQSTRKEFDGDITLVVFPFIRFSKLSPEITAKKIGELLAKLDLIDSFSVIQGFLNLVISNKFWLSEFSKSTFEDNYGFVDIDENSPNYLVEYCSPNTNKPIQTTTTITQTNTHTYKHTQTNTQMHNHTQTHTHTHIHIHTN